MGASAHGRHGLNNAARHEFGEHAPDGGVGDLETFGAQARADLGAAHMGKSWRNRSAACRKAGVHVLGRTRRGRRFLGAASFPQR
jgi:hypothetical protein